MPPDARHGAPSGPFAFGWLRAMAAAKASSGLPAPRLTIRRPPSRSSRAARHPGTTSTGHRHHHRRASGVGIGAATRQPRSSATPSRGAPLPAAADRRAPSPTIRRAFRRRQESQRGRTECCRTGQCWAWSRMELSGERLVRIGAPFEQHLHQIEGRLRVGADRAPPRSVEGELVRRGVAHFDGEVQRAVVGVGAELDERSRHVEAIVVDRNHRRRRRVAVLQVRVRAGGRACGRSPSFPARAANINALKPPSDGRHCDAL